MKSSPAALVLCIAWLATPPAATAASPSPSESPTEHWQGDVNFGLSLADGNSEFRSYSLTASGKRRDGDNRWSGKAFLHFAEEFDNDSRRFETSEDRKGLSAGFDRFITQRLYYLLQGALESDQQAEVDLRSTLGLGLGYQLFADDGFEYSIEGGLAHIREEFEQPPDEEYPAALLSHDLSYSINPHTQLTHSAELYPSLEDSSSAYGSAETGITFSLSERSRASLNWEVNWDDSPTANQKSTDHRLGVSLGLQF